MNGLCTNSSYTLPQLPVVRSGHVRTLFNRTQSSDQIYTGHFIKEVRQWEDLLVARTSNSDLLLAKLDLLAKEEAWQPLLVFAETETAQLVVLGFDISQAGELWLVGRDGREVTTQFLLSS